MSQLFYNGIELQGIRTNLFEAEPCYSEDMTEYLYTKFTLDVTAILNPSMTSYTQDANGVLTAAPGVLAAATHKAIRLQLLQPRKPLIFRIGETIILRSPPNDLGDDAGEETRRSDANNGPKVEYCRVTAVNGQRTLLVHFRVSTWLSECKNDSSRFLSHRWSETHSVTGDWFTVRTVTGTVVVRTDYKNADPATLGPDAYRSLLTHPIPARFKRDKIEVQSTSDGTRLAYRFSDVETYLPLGIQSQATKISGHFITACKWGGDPGAKSVCTVKVQVTGSPESSKAALFERAVGVAVGRLNVGAVAPGVQRDVIIQAAGMESLTDPYVELDITALRTPVDNGKQVLTLPIPWPPPADGAFCAQSSGAGKGGLDFTDNSNPPPPNSPLRGSWNGQAAAAALNSACRQNGPAAPTGPTVAAAGSNPAGPDIFVYVNDSLGTIDTQDTAYREVNEGIWTDSRVEIDYVTDECNVVMSISGSTDPLSSSDNTACSIINVGTPVTRKVVRWTCERLDAKPDLPSPAPKDGEALLSRKQGGLVVDLSPDGSTLIYRCSGEFVFALTNFKEQEGDFDMGSLQFHDLDRQDDKVKITSDQWKRNILG